MERLEQRLEIAKKSLKALKEALEMPIDKIVRDASIQRFEFSWEAVWKFVQLYLRVREGVDLGSPKLVFRHCFETGFFDENQTELALKMTDDRNLTVHTYNEVLADKIFSHLLQYYQLMSNLIKTIEKRMKES